MLETGATSEFSTILQRQFHNHLFHKQTLNHLAPLKTLNSFTVFMQTLNADYQVRVMGRTLTLLKQEDIILNSMNQTREKLGSLVLGIGDF